jgi:hypothetical protein
MCMRQLATMFIFTIPHCSRQPARLRRPDTVLTARHGEDLIWLMVRGFPGHPLWLHALWLWLLAVRFRWRGGAGGQSRARRRLARHARYTRHLCVETPYEAHTHTLCCSDAPMRWHNNTWARFVEVEIHCPHMKSLSER